MTGRGTSSATAEDGSLAEKAEEMAWPTGTFYQMEDDSDGYLKNNKDIDNVKGSRRKRNTMATGRRHAIWQHICSCWRFLYGLENLNVSLSYQR